MRNWHEDVETRPDSPPLFFLAVGAEQSEKDLVKQLLSSKLKRIMMTVDLETVTSRQVWIEFYFIISILLSPFF